MAKRKEMTGKRLRRTVEKMESGIGDERDDAELREVVRRHNAHDGLMAAMRDILGHCVERGDVTDDHLFRCIEDDARTALKTHGNE